MSRTVGDLVEAMRVDETQSFDADAVWQRAQHRAGQLRVRRSAVAVGAAVAVAAAIAAPSMVLLAGSPGPDPYLPGGSSAPTASASVPETTSAPSATVSTMPTATRYALSATVRAVSADGWDILPSSTDALMQHAYVRRSGGLRTMGSVEVYEPGAFDPTPILGGPQTTVDGKPAYFGWLADPFHTTRETRRSLAWPYTTDAWAVVRIEHPTPDPVMSPEIPPELVEIASVVEIGEPEPVKLPFRVGERPDGLLPAYVMHHEAVQINRSVAYDYAGSPLGPLVATRGLAMPLVITMHPALPPENWHPDTTIAGRPAMTNGSTIIVAVGDQWVTIGSGPASSTYWPKETIEAIFTGLTFADDWNDQSTWFDANVAA